MHLPFYMLSECMFSCLTGYKSVLLLSLNQILETHFKGFSFVTVDAANYRDLKQISLAVVSDCASICLRAIQHLSLRKGLDV